jgi:hypothetical protein
MSEPTRKTFADQLVAQDPPLTEEQYREHRMQLEKALNDASRRESRVRITVLVLWLLCVIIPYLVAGLWKVALPLRFLPAYPLLMCLLLIVTIVETVSYFVRFLPARLRAGSALNRSILLDLDRKISDLTSRVDQATKENPPEQKP